MISLKNNGLKVSRKKKLYEIHNDKKVVQDKIKLSTYKAYDYSKIYHPLKNKKVRLHRLKFVDAFCCMEFYGKDDEPTQAQAISMREISRRRRKIRAKSKRKWASGEEVVNWLASVGIEVKHEAEDRYIIKGRVYAANHIMVFANKKRIELGLEPFYMEGITEC
ncbi:MAG: hypothetical protein LBT63_01280 [Holosporaceae bacterium]|jgi:hypothetical protein|nr:hypothetical protein [Holosporaceae bacterium]